MPEYRGCVRCNRLRGLQSSGVQATSAQGFNYTRCRQCTGIKPKRRCYECYAIKPDVEFSGPMAPCISCKPIVHSVHGRHTNA